MNRPGHSLRLLFAAFEGRLPKEGEWDAVLDTSNRGWLTPALYAALQVNGFLHEVPEPVRAYLALLHERNSERNQRLRPQLLEAVRAMNSRGIQPVLLKGAIHLVSAPAERFGSRMISDLDIAIAPAEVEEARAALIGLGYRYSRTMDELGRPQDVGEIELHCRPGARSSPYLTGDLKASSELVVQDGAAAFVPCPTSQALHLIVHDMIKDGDYWNLGIDLRHLLDLAELAKSPAGIDWLRLRSVLSGKTARAALELQATALHDLCGVPVPPDLRCGRMTRLKHSARLLTVTRTVPGAVARGLGTLSLGLNRFRDGYHWRGAQDLSRRLRRVIFAPRRGSKA